MRATSPSPIAAPSPDRPDAGLLRRRRGAPRALLLAAPALAAALAVPAARADVVDRIVLRVNNEIVTLQDYQQRRNDRVQTILATPEIPADRRPELLAAAPRDALKELFDETLLLSRAEQLAVEVPEDRVEAAYQDARERSGMGEEEFVAAMRGAGLDPQGYRERLRRQLVFQEVIGREVQARVQVADDEVSRYYREHLADFATPEELRLRDLVILDSATPDADARVALGKEVQAKLDAGASLDDVADEYAKKGLVSGPSNLGFVATADLDPALAAAAKSLAIGSVSAPIPGKGGHHMLQLLGRREASTQPLTDVDDRIRRQLREQKYEQELRKYMQELADKAYIVQDPPPEAAGFRSAGTDVESMPAAPEPPPVAVVPEPATGPDATATPGVPPPAPGTTLPSPPAPQGGPIEPGTPPTNPPATPPPGTDPPQG